MSPGLASIIIPCWNQLEFTRQCIAALVRCTRPPWELIVIDNGSTDGTKDYCAGVRDAAAVPVTVVTNTTNRGFPAAINQGLKRARGEYLVLLNNDVVVTDGWLDQLTASGGRWIERWRGSWATRWGCAAFTPPGPPFARGGKDMFAIEWDGAALARRGKGRFEDRPGRADVELCGAAAVGRGRALSRPRRNARRLPGAGATSTSGSGSPFPSCRDSACS